jgi:hypothetical protein
MALLVTTLASGLASVFAGVDTFAAAGDGWASAYRSYAQGATAGVALPVFTGLEESVLAATLAGAFAAGIAAPGGTLAALEVAFIAFWVAPPILFGTGVTTLAPPGLAALITATFPGNLLAATGAEAAASIAAAFDSWTRLISVTLPGPTVVTLL